MKYLFPVLLFLIASCEQEVEVDTTPPTVSISSHYSGQTVNGIVTIEVITQDNEDISKVEFYIDDSLFFTDTEPPFEYEWNTLQYEDFSEHILKAISYDNSDNFTESQPILLTLDNSLLFVACEGNFGNGNGSIEVFRGNEKIQTVENIGDIVQSIILHDNNLFVAVNNSHKIKKFTITNSGLSLPGIEVDTDNSGPREMCIAENKLYFTNWNTKDIKILDLYNYTIETLVTLQNVPEDILTDGNYLWVTTPNLELYDNNQGSTVLKFNVIDGSLEETFQVGLGPEKLYLDANLLYVSRTMYDENWVSSYGSSTIDINTGEITIVTYGAGAACRSDIFKLNNNIYRATTDGAVPLDAQLNLNMAARIGASNNIYSGGSFDNRLILGSTDYMIPDTVFFYGNTGELERTLEVNVLPGDFAIYNY